MTNLPYNINILQNLCKQNNIIWKEHATQRLIERNILRSDVKQCIMNGEIIEEYPTDKPYPSCLVLGYTNTKRPIHIVCSIFDNHIFIITVYEPNLFKWHEDFKTRKEI